jgi:hypothetical protein
MAAATTAAIGIAASGYQLYKGIQDKSDAEKALDQYDRQEFNNIADSLQVSTLGSDLQREEAARLASTQTSALQGSGVRGVVGGLGRVEAGSQQLNRQIAAGLDEQQKQIDQMYAQDQANIRAMREQREQQDIAALSSQYSAGNQMMWQGISGVAQSAMAGARAIQDNSKKDSIGSTGFVANNNSLPTNNTTTQYDYYKNMSDIFKGLAVPQQNQAPTTNIYGQIPANAGAFMQNQFYSPNPINNPRTR